MPEAISNTSPLLYLHRIGTLDWLQVIFGIVWTSSAVANELAQGRQHEHVVPDIAMLSWLRVAEPNAIPSEWQLLALGQGELAVMAMARERPERILLLDDALARSVAKQAGLSVWGTLRVLLEAKACGLTPAIAPLVDQLEASGMWLSAEI
jgi:predicted nucleic acid-binding protein